MKRASLPVSRVMPEWRQIEHDVLARGRVDGRDLRELRRLVYSGQKIERRDADLLVGLHKRLEHLAPAFEQFYYQALKDHLLAHGRIDAEGAAWLRQLLFADGRIADEKRKFLHELRGEARQVCPEFQALFRESMGQPQEQRTCG